MASHVRRKQNPYLFAVDLAQQSNKTTLPPPPPTKHKGQSIISGNGAAIWSKNFGPTDHHQLPSSPLSRVSTAPSASAILTAAVFSESVQHRLWFCLHHLSCVKMAATQSYIELWNREIQAVLRTSPKSGCLSVGIVRSRTQATEFSFCFSSMYIIRSHGAYMQHPHISKLPWR
jgi:hypothetical protein